MSIKAFLQIIVCITGVGRWKIQHQQPQIGPHTSLTGRRRGSLRKEIHVVKTSDAAAKHFGAGQQTAVLHELRRDQGLLSWPNVLLQPCHQRQVVGHAAHQTHGGMRMRIDQPRQQHLLAQTNQFTSAESLCDNIAWQHGHNQPVMHHHCVILQHGKIGCHGGNPAGFYNEINVSDYRGNVFAIGHSTYSTNKKAPS